MNEDAKGPKPLKDKKTTLALEILEHFAQIKNKIEGMGKNLKDKESEGRQMAGVIRKEIGVIYSIAEEYFFHWEAADQFQKDFIQRAKQRRTGIALSEPQGPKITRVPPRG